jgi:Rps23 Pro-64 3,4-dihydroxylase Tpa1-like proline 4-hydroxylase
MNTFTDSPAAISRLTLPITLDGGLEMDPQQARTLGESMAGEYCFADPFPHIVLDDFLPQALAERMLEHFPAEPLPGDMVFEKGYVGLHKRQVFPGECDEAVRNTFAFFNSRPMLEFLEGLTAIQGLIPDPYFTGGGFHELRRGGKLGIHADFRINEQLHLTRRLNVLIYLNKDWRSEYGGELELWARDMSGPKRFVPPLFNRCVVFNTDADSFHGHPEPLNTPEERTRRSIALYYYTASKRVYEEVPAHSTMYVARDADTARVKIEALGSRTQNYLKDWLPPVAFRGLMKLKLALRRG